MRLEKHLLELALAASVAAHLGAARVLPRVSTPKPASSAPVQFVTLPKPPPAAEAPAPEPEPEPEPPSAPERAAPAPVTFESDVETSDAPVRNAHYRQRFEGTGRSHRVRVFNEAEDLDITFTCEEGEYVLEAAERAGYELPYSCRSGGCLSCSARTHQGTVQMGEQYVLEEEHQASGFILLCCTTVTSDAVFESHQQDNIQ